MKIILKLIWGIFAVIGILSTVLILFLLDGNTTISICPSTKGRYSEYVDLLQKSGSFEKDTATRGMILMLCRPSMEAG